MAFNEISLFSSIQYKFHLNCIYRYTLKHHKSISIEAQTNFFKKTFDFFGKKRHFLLFSPTFHNKNRLPFSLSLWCVQCFALIRFCKWVDRVTHEPRATESYRYIFILSKNRNVVISTFLWYALRFVFPLFMIETHKINIGGSGKKVFSIHTMASLVWNCWLSISFDLILRCAS